MPYYGYQQASYGRGTYAGIALILTVPMENVTVTPITSGLPGLLVSWDQVVPAGGEDFQSYAVYRRRVYTDPFGVHVTEVWKRLARPSPITVTEYRDYAVGSDVEYEYAVTWLGIDDEGVLHESPKTAATTSGEITWRLGGFIHDPSNAAIYVEALVSRVDSDQQQRQVELAVRGRRAGVSFIGERFERAYNLTFAEPLGERAWLQRLRTMLDRQYTTGALYCLRLAHTGEVVFGTLGSMSRSDTTATSTLSVAFLERHYEEAV